MQSKKLSLYEAWANSLLGIIASNLVLLAFGVPMSQASAITATMILISTVRSYIVRRLFNMVKVDV